MPNTQIKRKMLSPNQWKEIEEACKFGLIDQVLEKKDEKLFKTISSL